MRTSVILWLFSLILSSGKGLAVDANPLEISRKKPLERPQLMVDKMGPEHFLIPTEFATASFFQFSGKPGFEKLKVKRVQLVYTQFKVNPSFSQEKLNEERLDWLKKLWPKLFSMPGVTWQLVMQTGPKDQEAAKKVFHGFIITFEKESVKEMRKAEIKSFEELMSDSKIWTDTFKIVKSYRIKTRQEFTGKYLPNSTKKRKDGIEYDKEGVFGRSKKMLTVKDTVWFEKRVNYKIPKVAFASVKKYLSDSTVLLAIDEHPEWMKSPVIIDVTGSMSPYVAQILLWWKFFLNETHTHHFTVFNDGNKTPDHQKFVGKVKGVYQLKATNYEDLQSMVVSAMSKGDGGDSQENDIEAVLASQKSNPQAESFLLVTDNAAPVRDLSLLSNVKKQVNIIVCGRQDFLNPHLVEIAWKTGGAIFFKGHTYNDFSGFVENKEFTFGNERFLVSKGRVSFADNFKRSRSPFK
jgi:hypothetical protein